MDHVGRGTLVAQGSGIHGLFHQQMGDKSVGLIHRYYHLMDSNIYHTARARAFPLIDT